MVIELVGSYSPHYLQEMGDYCPSVIQFGMRVHSFSQDKNILRVHVFLETGGMVEERGRERKCCMEEPMIFDFQKGYSNYNVVVSRMLCMHYFLILCCHPLALGHSAACVNCYVYSTYTSVSLARCYFIMLLSGFIEWTLPEI